MGTEINVTTFLQALNLFIFMDQLCKNVYLNESTDDEKKCINLVVREKTITQHFIYAGISSR